MKPPYATSPPWFTLNTSITLSKRSMFVSTYKSREPATERAARRRLGEHLANRLPVRESEHVVEVLLCVLWVATRVRPAEHRHRTPRPKQRAQGVNQLRSFGERTYKDKVDFLRQLLYQILKTCVAHQRDVVSLLLTPHCYDLGHDRGEIGIHHAGEQCSSRSF